VVRGASARGGIRSCTVTFAADAKLSASAAAAAQRGDEAQGEESRGVVAALSAATECAGKSPPPEPEGARATGA
jgi:hypothetical protein